MVPVWAMVPAIWAIVPAAWGMEPRNPCKRTVALRRDCVLTCPLRQLCTATPAPMTAPQAAPRLRASGSSRTFAAGVPMSAFVFSCGSSAPLDGGDRRIDLR